MMHGCELSFRFVITALLCKFSSRFCIKGALALRYGDRVKVKCYFKRLPPPQKKRQKLDF